MMPDPYSPHKFYNTLLQRMNVGFNYLTDSEVGDTSP